MREVDLISRLAMLLKEQAHGRAVITQGQALIDDAEVLRTHLRKVHLPKETEEAVKRLRQMWDSNAVPVDDTELNEIAKKIDKAELIAKINEQLDGGTRDALPDLQRADKVLLAESLAESFESSDTTRKVKVLQLAAQFDVLPVMLDEAQVGGAEVIVGEFLTTIDKATLIRNLRTTDEYEINENDIALALITRNDVREIAKDLLARCNSSQNIAKVLYEMVDCSEDISKIFTFDQCHALHKMIYGMDEREIFGNLKRLFYQVDKAFPTDRINFFERIIEGEESYSTRYAVNWYALRCDNRVPLLHKTLLRLQEPDNIISTCSALSRYGGKKGKEAIVDAVMEQSASDDQRLVLYTLCRAKQFREVPNNLKIYQVPDLQEIIFKLFLTHKSLIEDLETLEDLDIKPKIIIFHKDRIYQALGAQLGDVNIPPGWLFEEAIKTDDLRENILAINVLKFLAKFNWEIVPYSGLPTQTNADTGTLLSELLKINRAEE